MVIVKIINQLDMKKIFLSVTLLAASMAVYAQNPVQTTLRSSVETTEATVDNAAQKTAPLKGKKDGKHRKDLRKNLRGEKCDSVGKRCRATTMFDGLNLTADQKTRLDALRTKYSKECKGEQKAMDKDKKADLTKEQKQQKMAELAAKRETLRKNYLAGVKEILTPEQYSTFLENYYAKSRRGHHPKIDRRASRKDRRLDRPGQVSMKATPMTAKQQQ